MAEANDKKLRILHISDIHYSSKNKDVFDSMVKTPFLKFIKEKNSEKQIDIICLTGDLIRGLEDLLLQKKHYLILIIIFSLLYWIPLILINNLFLSALVITM